MTEPMPQSTERSSHLPPLKAASDEELRKIISEAKALLDARENDRKKDAIAKIKALAKEHGLDVAIDHQKRKRGRPKTAQGG